MTMATHAKKFKESGRWSVGIDPGFGSTALVLMHDAVPVAAAVAREKSSHPLVHRTHRMALWQRNTIQAWIHQYDIRVLHVVIETAFLRNESDDKRGVSTLMTQMRMLGTYLEQLYFIQDCEVWVGEVSNTTAKKVLTGHGKASKDLVINNSVWARRSDLVDARNHLADAQAIGTCYPQMFKIQADVMPVEPYHVDGGIGEGPAWKGKL